MRRSGDEPLKLGTTLGEPIESAFATLSTQLQRAARFVAEHPAEVAMHSMRRVASQAGVAPATMLRLARRLGLADYETLRGICRDLVRRSTDGSPFAQRGRALQSRSEDQPGRGLLADLLRSELDNLNHTLVGDEAAQRLAAATDILLAARRVFVIGRRSCYPVASFFVYAYRLFRANAVLVEDCAGSFGHDLLTIDASDALLAVSFEPYSAETIAVVETARAAGARVIAITDTAFSPLGRAAAVPLIAANSSPAFLQSIVAATALAQALVSVLFLRSGSAAVVALEANEARLRDHGAYWTADNARGRTRQPAGATPFRYHNASLTR